METTLRILSLLAGLFLFWTAASAVVSTMLVPRSARQWLSRWVANILHWIFASIAAHFRSYEKVDRLLAVQSPFAVSYIDRGRALEEGLLSTLHEKEGSTGVSLSEP